MMTFLPDLSVLAAYTLAAAVLTLTPGPDMMLYLGKTIAFGRPAGFSAFLGTATGLVVHAGLAALGVSALLAASTVAFGILKIVGVGYLLYLAWDALRNGTSFAPVETGGAEPLARIYLKGFLVNVLNPKIVVFFVTFLPQFIDAADPEASGRLLFLGLWYTVVTVPLTIVLILAASGIARTLKASPRALKALDYAFAGVMAGFALKLVTARAA